jgi:hypothetical protein
MQFKIHICSFNGDIEVLPGIGGNANTATIRYMAVTPQEKAAVESVLGRSVELIGSGDLNVDVPYLKLAEMVAHALHPEKDTKIISAVKFSGGEIIVSQAPIADIVKSAELESSDVPPPQVTAPVAETNRLAQHTKPLTMSSTIADIKMILSTQVPPIKFSPKAGRVALLSVAARNGLVEGYEPATKRRKSMRQSNGELASQPETGVQVKMPPRGCPMPTFLELRERKARQVVEKFLAPRQLADFRVHGAFISIGSNTGKPYRITSRWAPSVEKYGVLYDIKAGFDICAQNKDVPPSEEVLGMKFAIEAFENEFLEQPSEGHSFFWDMR